MIDLGTTYLGLALRTPLVVSSSPLTASLGRVRAAEDVGAGAVVLHSLFEEQLALETLQLEKGLAAGSGSSAESVSFLPDIHTYKLGPDAYLEHIRKAKAAVDIPVVASLNGTTAGTWVRYAKLCEEAGADAIELNIYYLATDPSQIAANLEHQYVELLKAVRAAVTIPVAVKTGPQFSAFANFAHQLCKAGASGLVLFNRFYQPELDIEKLEVAPTLSLSTPAELALRLHWVGVLYGKVKTDFAVTGGVHSGTDVLKAMMAGASVAMLASALLQKGVKHLATVKQEMLAWMEAHEYASVQQMRGSLAQKAVPNPGAYERGNYIKVLSAYEVK